MRRLVSLEAWRISLFESMVSGLRISLGYPINVERSAREKVWIERKLCYSPS